MKYSFTLFLFFLTCSAYAQNWQCAQPGLLKYFINGDGYLRGIRIDSSGPMLNGTFLKPFRTKRVTFGKGATDSVNGSWLGAEIIVMNDGTHLFKNTFKDTIVIKAMAGIGDSWTFYSDTSSIHFDATVLSVDTATVLGSLDSIKTIGLQTKNAANVAVSSTVNSFKIVLSKEHGFISVFDLYGFPTYSGDLFTSQALQNVSWPGSWKFDLINFHNPTRKEIYDFHPGDIFQFDGPYVPLTPPVSSKYSDTIISRKDSSGILVYGYANSTMLKFYTYFIAGDLCFASDPSINKVDSTTLLPNNIVPEEYPSMTMYYYWPNDTTYCRVGDLYEVNNQTLSIEMTYNVVRYKTGIGKIYEVVRCHSSAQATRAMQYVKYNGVDCGFPAGISSLNENLKVEIYPNPASDHIYFKRTTTTDLLNVAIYDVYGRQVYAQTWTDSKLSINTNNYCSGMYTVKLTDDYGNTEVKKVMVIK